MSNWQKAYLQFINAAARFVGVCFALGGTIFIIYGISSGGALFVIPGLVVTVLGVLLIFAKPYRPDLRDSASPESADSHKMD